MAMDHPWGSRRWLAALVGLIGIALFVPSACGGPDPTQPSASTPTVESTQPLYLLKNSAEDAEYVLAWGSVTAQCPLLDGQPLLEGFVREGEQVEIAPGETLSIGEGSRALWGSTRLVREGDPNTGDFASFAVEITLLQEQTMIEDLLAAFTQAGGRIQEGPVTTGIQDSDIAGLPKEAHQTNAIATAHRLLVNIRSHSGGERGPWCDRDDIEALIDQIGENLGAVQAPAA